MRNGRLAYCIPHLYSWSRQVVPMFDQRQVLLDFDFDKSQSGLKLFLARELEACLVVLGMAVVGGG